MEAPEINTTSYESDRLILRKPTIADKGELLDYRVFVDGITYERFWVSTGLTEI